MKPPLPQSMAQDDHRARVWRAIFFRRETSPEHGPHTQHIEIIPADNLPPDRVRELVANPGWTFLLADRHCRYFVSHQAGEDIVIIAKVNVTGVRVKPRMIPGKNARQFIGPLDRQRAKEKHVHDAEDRRIGPDAQAEREHGHQSETGGFQQHSRAEAQVLPEVFYPSQPALISICLLHLRHSTETEPRRSLCFFQAHPLLQIVLNLHLEMRADLLLQLSFDTSLQKQAQQTMKENA